MSQQDPPAQKIDREEAIAGVKRVCELNSIPVATTGAVAELDDIEIEQQRTREVLKELAGVDEDEDTAEDYPLGATKAGGYVFWPAEGNDSGGAIDSDMLTGDTIDWEQVDPDRVPESILRAAIRELDIDAATEVLADHPEYDEPTVWERRLEIADSIVGISSVAMLSGLGVFALRGTQFGSYIPGIINQIGATALIGGLFFNVIIGIPYLGYRIAEWVMATKPAVWLSNLYADNQERINEKLPSVSIEWPEWMTREK